MFKELRIKFTIVNALTLIVFLLLFILALDILISHTLKTSGEAYLKEIAKNTIENSPKTDKSFHAQIPTEYIIYNDSGAVIAQSVNSPELIESARTDLDDPGFDTVDVDGIRYRVYTEKFDKTTPETIQVFQNISAEEGVLSVFLTLVISIGFVGLLALVPISYFLAGRSLGPIKKTFSEQKQFIADASHELRTPLTIIQSNLDLLSFKGNERINENKEKLVTIESECRHMNRLISELLLIAKADNDKLEYVNRELSLSDLTYRIIQKLEGEYDNKGIALIADIDSEIDYFGDEEKLEEVITILLDNALKYTGEGGNVKLSLNEDEDNVYITVLDTGIGIDESEQDRIFDRFYRCDAARTESGTGLGLNILKTIVEGYDGGVRVVSEKGVGSEFRVELPRENSD